MLGKGHAATVSVAGFDVAVPHTLVTLQWNSAPLSPATSVKLYVAVVPPVPIETAFQVTPPSLLRSHW